MRASHRPEIVQIDAEKYVGAKAMTDMSMTMGMGMTPQMQMKASPALIALNKC
jgi:hypothetical protein